MDPFAEAVKKLSSLLSGDGPAEEERRVANILDHAKRERDSCFSETEQLRIFVERTRQRDEEERRSNEENERLVEEARATLAEKKKKLEEEIRKLDSKMAALDELAAKAQVERKRREDEFKAADQPLHAKLTEMEARAQAASTLIQSAAASQQKIASAKASAHAQVATAKVTAREEMLNATMLFLGAAERHVGGTIAIAEQLARKATFCASKIAALDDQGGSDIGMEELSGQLKGTADKLRFSFLSILKDLVRGMEVQAIGSG